ncbi:AP-1 complex subunit mu-1-I [Smittium mucronatum]|uniref:AP-1 complex subunit mu-1-I n=1 Tax=Smittium mucronatum TaxID=133383 RepID=A0A1R0GUB6_9FUNG|nr:AP-1 complex subunit mu-1-I [Smittium mucronatum]
MASSVFVLDNKGKPLIARDYKGDIPMSAIDNFMPLLQEKEETEGTAAPVLFQNGVVYMYLQEANIYLVAMSRKDSNAMTILQFLRRLSQVFTEYFKNLEEESIRDNFVIIYELLDEMMDYGIPQLTETKILKEYITQESHALEIQLHPPTAATNAVSWRSDGIFYRKNEVFLDIVESINMLINSNGTVLSGEIMGAIKMKVYLSGMPELRLGLNDKTMFEKSGKGFYIILLQNLFSSKGKAIEMEDVKFHQCVRLNRFESDRTISFIPPDGDFELMTYRLGIQAKSQFKQRSTANNVEIIVPVPEDCDSPKFKCSTGNVSYAPEINSFVWKIKQFPGSKQEFVRAHFGLPSIRDGGPEKRPPISIKFDIPYFTTSGIQVRYLKIVERSGYQALPWVRYITKNGEYQVRMPEPLKDPTGTHLPRI